MAGGNGASISLSIRRSGQSGDKLTTAAWQTIFIDSDTIPYLFVGGSVDLTNMALGDELHVRVSKKVSDRGNFIPHEEFSYFDAQSPTLNKPALQKLASAPDIYGIQIEIIQRPGLSGQYRVNSW